MQITSTVKSVIELINVSPEDLQKIVAAGFYYQEAVQQEKSLNFKCKLHLDETCPSLLAKRLQELNEVIYTNKKQSS